MYLSAAAYLRERLTERPYQIHSVWGHNFYSWVELDRALADLVNEDAASLRTPSLLLLAAAACDTKLLRRLAIVDAKPLPGEDLRSALVESYALQPDANDAQVVDALRHVPHDWATFPSTGPSRATVVCAEKAWTRSLALLTLLDPWAMHHLQSLPSSIAAGKEAADDAAATTVAIAAGDEIATRHAVELLVESMKHAAEWGDSGDPCHVAAARNAMHTMLQVHQAAGTLSTLVAHPDASDILRSSCSTGDVDMTVSLIAAGARAVDDFDVYTHLEGTTLEIPRVANGTEVTDERLALYLLQLYNIGTRLLYCDPTVWLPEPSEATVRFFRGNFFHCLRVMVTTIDPHARVADGSGFTLMHHAAAECRVPCITMLRQQLGWDVHERNGFGHTALDVSMSKAEVADSCVATIAALTADMDDVRPLLATSRSQALMMVQRDLEHLISRNDPIIDAFAPFGRNRRRFARMLLHTHACARTTPAAPFWASDSEYSLLYKHVDAPHLRLFRSEALDAHSADGTYIPDQLRAPGNASDALALALHVDATIDMLRCRRKFDATYDEYQDFGVREVYEDDRDYAWRRYKHRCRTLESWAYMRRLHALLHRLALLQELNSPIASVIDEH